MNIVNTALAMVLMARHDLSKLRPKDHVSTPSDVGPQPTVFHGYFSTDVPDFFSNDYLSITNNPQLNNNVLHALIPSKKLLGSTGSRLLNGNSPSHAETEKYLQSHFNAPAALMFTSGYDANVAFFGCVPQAEDIIVFDELIHASVRDGIAAARTRNVYLFSHNSVVSFESCIAELLKNRPEILAGNLYSMDGDFSPLPQIIETLHRYIPRAYSHMVVDEAHTTGLYGLMGRGYVEQLGLQNEVDTVLHTFGKARGLTGAVILTSPIIRKYLINYARPLIYTTSMPHFHLIAIRSTFEFISGAEGDRVSIHFGNKSTTAAGTLLPNLGLALKDVPKSVLAMCAADRSKGSLVSPIFPLLTNQSLSLAEYLNSKGYSAQAIPFPAVPRGQERIRVVIHAENTFSSIDVFIGILLDWAMSQRSKKGKEVGGMPMSEPSPKAML
ncbi:aminotransferase [Desarmillaria tabescens]|uniref:Aminotransferase n=1 Tax=Armillaria tabescens TaxID=1929756 RepID=A0AA39JCS2_ARMTA|nr:aminotransferase [Desarmillaria tabescens]KAK0439949.1 aminotransferase [Desarmillaria tabescens]